MWSGGVSYDVGGKGFDPTVGKITKAVQGGSKLQKPNTPNGWLPLGNCKTTLKKHPNKKAVPGASRVPGDELGEEATQHMGVRSTLLAGILCCNTTLSKAGRERALHMLS